MRQINFPEFIIRNTYIVDDLSDCSAFLWTGDTRKAQMERVWSCYWWNEIYVSKDGAILVLAFLRGVGMGEGKKRTFRYVKTIFDEESSEYNTCTSEGRDSSNLPTIFPLSRVYKARLGNVLFIFSLLTLIFTHSRSPKLPQNLKLPLTWKELQLNNHRRVAWEKGEHRKQSWWVYFVTIPHLKGFSAGSSNGRRNLRKNRWKIW